MPGSTPTRGIPYPSPTDPINAYPALAQDAAQNLDTHTHDKTTVSTAGRADTAATADYATSAGNADTVDGQHAAAFMPAGAIYVGKVQVTTNAAGLAFVNAGGKTSVLVANVNGGNIGGPTVWSTAWDLNAVTVNYSGAGTWQAYVGAITLSIVAI